MQTELTIPTFLLLLSCLLPTTGTAELSQFGYSGIICDLDDPHDNEIKTDYIDEVTDFTNVNHICLTGDLDQNAGRIERAAEHFTPLLDISPLFFEQRDGRLRRTQDLGFFMSFLTVLIDESRVPAKDLIFYLVDEPTLRGLSGDELSGAAADLKEAFPETPLLVIEAFHIEGPPAIPEQIDYWGFDAYAIPDPAAEPLYTAYLDAAARALAPHQKLVLVLDANHTPYHRDAGLSKTDMADVADAYFEYANARGDITMMLGYTWAGGIDNIHELGARDMPTAVIDAHRRIGKQIIGASAPE